MDSKSSTYSINGEIVGRGKFEEFLKPLKQIDGTWYCMETTSGGITGYEAKDARGARYRYSAESGGKNEAKIVKVEKP